ncbi:hypothetical protein JOM56_001565 [Amanita muscaria]
MPPRPNLSEIGRRNIVYSEAEQIFIKNAVKTTKAGLLRLGTLRSNGAARRRQLNDQIRRCKVALAPYKKIPKEIWLYIFELYCQPGRLSTRVTGQPPVVLTQVCSAWRQIAILMPKLWSDVHLGKGVNLAKIWLRRAGNIPRALETTREPSHCFDSNRPLTIQDFICSFPFKKLHLTECDAVGIDFTRIPVKSLLLLEDLALLKPACNSSLDMADRTVFGMGGTFYPHPFPNLVSLQIDTNTVPCFYGSARCKKLRILRLECGLAKSTCIDILRDVSSLEDCSLRLSRPHYGQGSSYSKIENAVVANLKILKLTFSYTPSLWSFLDHLTFQNLHTLILIAQNCVYFKPRDKSRLLRLAQRIGSLKSLNIRLHGYVDVGRVLECLPLLQVLEAPCTRVTTHEVEKIGRGELGGCLRELHDCGFHNLYQFLKACELRRDVTQGQCPNSSGAIASLDKVSVRASQRGADCKWRIRELRKDGVEFEVFLA